MPENHDEDLVRVHDILEAAQKIRNFVAERSRQSFDDDELLQLALRYLVQIIGEAAYNVSRERKARYPERPWTLVTGMRLHLVDGYSDIDLNILWVAVTENVPKLVNDLEKLLVEEFGS